MSGDAGKRRNVQTIPAGYPFARTLAQNLLMEAGGSPEALARISVLLPTRRACRVLRDCFLELSGGRPILLPRMTPIGDVDEGELSLLFMGQGGRMDEVPPAISPIRRLLILSRLLQAGEGFAGGGDQAIALAQALAGLVDQTHTEGKSLSQLAELVPEGFAAHWQITLKFLQIVIEHWPKILEEEGLIDPALRRVLLLQALADFWRAHPDQAGRVIAAGSTGSIPATAGLLDAVSQLPQGRVILPGLDLELDQESWDALDETHPQYQMKKLLSRMEVSRAEVQIVVPPSDSPDGVALHEGRRVLIRELMRPAQTTVRWANLKYEIAARGIGAGELLRGVRYYPCDTAQEEASVIALLLREALEVPERTASLITPDRALARRVAAQCLRWGIVIDDSAGATLSQTPAGRYLALVLRAGSSPFDPAALLALLKHPLCRIGREPVISAHVLQRFEMRILRNDRKRPRDLREALTFAREAGLTDVAAFLSRLCAVLDGLSALDDGGAHPAEAHFTAHIEAAERLAAGSEGETLWSGEDGAEAAGLLSELRLHAEAAGALRRRDYAEIIGFLMSGATVRPKFGAHARLKILGQLEARLGDADLVILGGLNEGTWPSGAAFDPWMSREMRANFGLPGLERSVGLAAHDFAQAFCASEIVLTRARKVDGAPTVPARWLQKMDTVLRACGADPQDLTRGPHREWAGMLDRVEDFTPVSRPAPRPPLSYRPTKVSVTRVETWLRDPYGYYAAYTLGLRKIPDLTVKADAALRGQILHKAVESFIKAHPERLPERAEDVLRGFLAQAAGEALYDPEMIRFWAARAGHAMDWVAGHEARWRERARFYAAEVKGEIVFEIDGEPFTLHGRVDRIDRLPNGYAIIDYKSGGSYTKGKMESGQLPQLPLEAVMLRRGGFASEDGGTIEAGECAYLGYWIFRSGAQGGTIEALEDTETIEHVAEAAENSLIALVRAFRDPLAAYHCIPDAARAPMYNDFEHLERIREWSVNEADSEGAQT